MKEILATVFLLCALSIAYSQQPIILGEKHEIHSEILGEDREIWLGLPARFDSTRTYPCIFVMDAEWQFQTTMALVHELCEGDKVPAHIVVGIPHIDTRHRFNDLTFSRTNVSSDGEPDADFEAFLSQTNTGGGEAFFKHLTDEVIPFVQDRFLTNGFDVFIGHSLSGYFGAYILSMDSPFEAYQLYDPSIWYNDGDATKRLGKLKSLKSRPNVFISSAEGGKDRQQFNVDNHERFHEAVEKCGGSSVWRRYNDKDHISVRLPSLIDGLSGLYEGYSIGFIMPTDHITVAQAEKHYRDFSKKVNYEFPCPADAYRWIGFANHFQGRWKEALKAYRLAWNTFQGDANVCREMADCYAEIGDYKQSLKHYEKALALDPANAAQRSRIEEIRKRVAED